MKFVINEKKKLQISKYKELNPGDYFIWKDGNKSAEELMLTVSPCVKINKKSWFRLNNSEIFTGGLTNDSVEVLVLQPLSIELETIMI